MNEIQMKLWQALAAGFLMLPMLASAAPVTIDPSAGASGDFYWDSDQTGTGLSMPITSIDSYDLTVDGDEFWTITTGSAATIDASIIDCCVAGDGFALLLNGSMVAPTTSSGGGGPGGGIFSATWTGIFLSAGMHRFDVIVTDSCCTGPGMGSYTFSGLTRAAVPAPGTLALLGLGLLGFGVRRQRAA